MSTLPDPGLAHDAAPAPPARPVAGWRSLRGLVKALTILLAISAVAELASGAAALYRASVVQRLLDGDLSALASADASDMYAGLTSIVAVGLRMGIGVVFVVWMWRLIGNAQLLDRAVAPHKGWAIGAWLIPFANVVLPGLNLARADRASDTDGVRGNRLIVVAWAVVFSTAWVVERAVIRNTPDEPVTDEDFSAWVTGDRLLGAVALVWVAAAVLAIFLVRRLSARQDAAFHRGAQAVATTEYRRSVFVPPPGYSAPIQTTPAAPPDAPVSTHPVVEGPEH